MSRDKQSTYYDAGGIEVLDIIKAKLTPEQYRGYLLGNVIKYVCRVNWKGGSADDKYRDIEKGGNYLRWLRETLIAKRAPVDDDTFEWKTEDEA